MANYIGPVATGVVAGILLGFLLGVAISEGSGSLPYQIAYKDGQVDYASGKVKWILVKQADGSVLWKENR